DFEMIYYNADGLPGTMCGNGGRCAAAFAQELGIVDKTAEFLACDGPHRAEIYKDRIKLSMADVGQPERVGDDFFVDTGSPHYVIFTDRTDELDVFSKGREVRYNERFSKEGTNVNFVEALPGKIRMRTYERGVEDETLSCGTGVCAAAICSSIRHPDEFAGRCDVQTRGGMLKVYFCVNGSGIFSDVWLEGPAVRVFSGIIKL
ncbi:MAG: diaminopimelate epimerase, partial [Flavobacteriales bacterium]